MIVLVFPISLLQSRIDEFFRDNQAVISLLQRRIDEFFRDNQAVESSEIKLMDEAAVKNCVNMREQERRGEKQTNR